MIVNIVVDGCQYNKISFKAKIDWEKNYEGYLKSRNTFINMQRICIK